MKISIIHPSRGRAKMAYQTAMNWINNADGYLQYILSIDKTDTQEFEYQDLFLRREISIKAAVGIASNYNKSAIEAINTAAKTADGDLLIIVSDDFDAPEHWDTLLLKGLQGKEDLLVKTQDGIQKTLITLPIMDRKYYERFGYVYHPDYKHMFSDQEMTAVGHMLGKVIDLPLVFSHNHYTVGGMKKDAINVKNDNTWLQGEMLFNERLKSNFGLKDEEIVKPYNDIIWR